MTIMSEPKLAGDSIPFINTFLSHISIVSPGRGARLLKRQRTNKVTQHLRQS